MARALVMGGSGIPIPPESYVDAADTLYLEPRGFTGSPQALDTPEGFYPTTGVNSLTADASEAQGRTDFGRRDHGPDRQRKRGRREPCRGFRLLAELRAVVT